MGLFKRDKSKKAGGPDPSMPPKSERDYSHIDSREKAQAAVASGELVQILMMPEAFGGDGRPENVLFVPPGFDDAKSMLDGTILRFAREGLINKFACDVDYHGTSTVPARLNITCTNSDPAKTGSFNPTLEIW